VAMSDKPSGEAARLRLFLADNNVLFRAGLTRLLGAQPDFEVVGEADAGLETVRLVGILKPYLVLIDTNIQNCDAYTAARLITERDPACQVVFLTLQEDEAEMFDCVRAGACGYVAKSVTPEQLFEYVRSTAYGGGALSPHMAASLMRAFASLSAGAAPKMDSDLLTPREREVLALVARGLTNKEIGVALSVSEYTARNHLRHILDKLNLYNRTQAAAYAVRAGIVSLSDLTPASDQDR
jgi:two-component system nitrate/nitrite response regulator NarL